MNILKKLLTVFVLFTNIVLIFVAIAIASEALNIEPLHLIGGLILFSAIWELLDIIIPWVSLKWRWYKWRRGKSQK